MKGDFSRLDFDRATRFSRVLAQQGRVTLDSDLNESGAILLRHIRMLTRDLYGPAGGPADGGFGLRLDTGAKPARLTVGAGHYYVDGILCEADAETDYAAQPSFVPPPPDAAGKNGDPLLAWLGDAQADGRFYLYLDVWERHVSWIEDDSIREPALGGADTCSRAQVVWQVKALPWSDDWNREQDADSCLAPLGALVALGGGQMAAQLDPGDADDDPCIVAPGAHYRGAENQLYRIEIQEGGTAGTATFKWSRDNASLAARWIATDSSDNRSALVVEPARGFMAGDWVELSHDALAWAGLPGELVQLASVEGDRLALVNPPQTAWQPTLGHPSVRRWDQRTNDDIVLRDGAVPITETSATDPGWIDLGDGLQIRFAAGGSYRSGDYWTVRASAATAGIDWPLDGAGQAVLLPPAGVEHHYAALGIVSRNSDGSGVSSCRTCFALGSIACAAPAAPAQAEADGVTTRPRQPAPLPTTGAGRVNKTNPKPR